MLQELSVHHASSEAIIVSLHDRKGYGRLTVESLGGDALARRMFSFFAKQQTVHVSYAAMQRDSDGYVPLSVNLFHLCSDLFLLEGPVREMIGVLYRKQCLCGLGMITSATVVKASSKGAVLSLANGLPAVTLQPLEDPSVEEIDVRVIDYDPEKNITVVHHGDSLAHAPPDAPSFAAAVASIDLGEPLACPVLYTDAQRHVVVVEVVPSRCNHMSLLGYVQITETDAIPHQGELIRVWIKYLPSKKLQGLTPFLVCSNRASSTAPLIRSLPQPAALTFDPMHSEFPWRRRQRDMSELDLYDDGDTTRKQRRRKLEEAIDSYERNVDKTPTSPEDFQKLLLASPNDSYLWTRYIAFHVELRQLEEAREVAEKALQTIGVRESRELLNVWVAYMNIESLYGTGESLSSVFRRAVERNDNPLLVYEKLADVFASAKKYQQLLSLCRSMTSKFRSERRVWERLGRVLVDANKRDQLKRMLKDMNGALSKSDQCLVAEHIAIHEYRSGLVDNARSLFEGLISKIPKKSDVWSTYIDQELALLARKDQHASASVARSLFERVTATNLPPKVMQQFLTRFLAFEGAHGTPADVEKVKERARAYVASRVAPSSEQS